MLDRRLGRPLAPRKPGPKPRVERDTARQAAVKSRVNCHRNPIGGYAGVADEPFWVSFGHILRQM
jgi:hypothetical protein